MSDSDEVSTNSTVSSVTLFSTITSITQSYVSSNIDISDSSTVSTTNSDSPDEMEIESDDDSMDIEWTSSVESDNDNMYIESDSETILTTSTEETDNDSSSDYVPSEEEAPSKKRKRNTLDTFCLYTIKPKNPTDTNLYVGSTINFARRKSQHKKASTNKRSPTYWSMLYRYIRSCGGFDNFIMEKVLDFPCETKHEGLLKEKEYIRTLNATLNTANPVADTYKRFI
jgi:hypothetical protein